MTNKLRIYLDVDGVLNTFGHAYNRQSTWPTVKVGKATGYSIHWSPELLQALDDLDAEIVWLTTWLNHAAGELADLLEWGHDFRVLHYNDEDAWMYQQIASINWKKKALVSDQEANPSPFVWFDDEIGLQEMALAERLGGLAIYPDQLYGIEPTHILKVKEYLEGLK